MAAVPAQASQETILQQLIAVLGKVSTADRPRFARMQLIKSHPRLVHALEHLPDRKRAVLFVSSQPHSRESRLARCAQSAGWNPLFVHIAPPRFDPGEYFSFHEKMEDLVALTLACWLFPGALVHAFALTGEPLYLLARLKPRRLVVEIYDTCAGRPQHHPRLIQQEREVLARADGIVHRDLRVHWLKRRQKYSTARHHILIHDPLANLYDWNQAAPGDSDIHIVSTGWVGTEANSILRVAKALGAAGVHLHVFCNPLQSRDHLDLRDYVQLERQCRFFHLEESVFGPAYWDRLHAFDFGISILEPAIFGEPLQGYTIDAITGCGSSRVADYVAANLGVIISPQLRFQSLLTRHYAPVCVEANQAFLANPRPALEAAREFRATHPPKDRSGITIEKIGTRLNRFYEKVAS